MLAHLVLPAIDGMPIGPQRNHHQVEVRERGVKVGQMKHWLSITCKDRSVHRQDAAARFETTPAP